MIIDILNSVLKSFDILKDYTYVNYKKEGRGLGSFEIHISVTERNRYLLDDREDFYVLFNKKVFGKIETVKYNEDDEDKKATISGRLSNLFFTKRVIDATLNYKGSTLGFVYQLLDMLLIKPKDSLRKMNINKIIEDPEKMFVSVSSYNKQVTGGYIWDAFLEALEVDKLCIDFIPVYKPVFSSSEGYRTNIDEWDMVLYAGRDRTKGNKDGNKEIVFSRGRHNICDIEFALNNKDYRNTAYVAAEGEGKDRKWFKKDRLGFSETGWIRNELWIDARDIQSEKDDGTIMTPEEYEKLVTERIDKKFIENDLKEAYSATLINIGDRYKYGVDFKIGDYVTIKDEELNVMFDAQVVSYSVTLLNDGETKVDIGYVKGNEFRSIIPADEFKKIDTKIESVEANIQALNEENNRNNKVSEVKKLSEKEGLTFMYYEKNGIITFSVNGVLKKDYSPADSIVSDVLIPEKLRPLVLVSAQQSFFDRHYILTVGQDGSVRVTNFSSAVGGNGNTIYMSLTYVATNK